MSARGSITLGELRGKLDMLDVACSRCDRRGRLRLDRLIAEHGAGMGLPALRGVLAGDSCLHAGAVGIHDRCGVHFPQSDRHLRDAGAALPAAGGKSPAREDHSDGQPLGGSGDSDRAAGSRAGTFPAR